MKRGRGLEEETKGPLPIREQFLRGKILPSNCLYIAMAEEAYNIKDHVEESRDNLVVFFPLPNDQLRAVCVTRGELQQYALVFYQCLRNSLAPDSVIQDAPYYQLQITEFPIYVSEENFEAMIKNRDTPFFLAQASDLVLSRTVSKRALEPDADWMSADHCQDGTEKIVSTIYPVNAASVAEILQVNLPSGAKKQTDEAQCQRKTKQGMRCLQMSKFGLKIGADCVGFCVKHLQSSLYRFLQMLKEPMALRIESRLVHIVSTDSMILTVGNSQTHLNRLGKSDLMAFVKSLEGSMRVNFYATIPAIQDLPTEPNITQRIALNARHAPVTVNADVRQVELGDPTQLHVTIDIEIPNRQELAKRYEIPGEDLSWQEHLENYHHLLAQGADFDTLYGRLALAFPRRSEQELTMQVRQDVEQELEDRRLRLEAEAKKAKEEEELANSLSYAPDDFKSDFNVFHWFRFQDVMHVVGDEGGEGAAAPVDCTERSVALINENCQAECRDPRVVYRHIMAQGRSAVNRESMAVLYWAWFPDAHEDMHQFFQATGVVPALTMYYFKVLHPILTRCRAQRQVPPRSAPALSDVSRGDWRDLIERMRCICIAGPDYEIPSQLSAVVVVQTQERKHRFMRNSNETKYTPWNEYIGEVMQLNLQGKVVFNYTFPFIPVRPWTIQLPPSMQVITNWKKGSSNNITVEFNFLGE